MNFLVFTVFTSEFIYFLSCVQYKNKISLVNIEVFHHFLLYTLTNISSNILTPTHMQVHTLTNKKLESCHLHTAKHHKIPLKFSL